MNDCDTIQTKKRRLFSLNACNVIGGDIEYQVFHTSTSNKAVIFLHGWGGDYNNFKSSILTLEKYFSCVNVSFFVAKNIEKPLTLDDYCAFVKDIIIDLRENYAITEITVVGHSFGGRVGLRLASQGVIDKLVLVDSAGLKPKIKFSHILRKLAFESRKLLRMDTSKCGSSDYRALSQVMKGTFSNIVTTYQDDELAKITIPTLIFWGEKDKETPLYMAKKLNRGINSSGLYIVADGGHYSYLDSPREFLNGVKMFVLS